VGDRAGIDGGNVTLQGELAPERGGVPMPIFSQSTMAKTVSGFLR